MGPIVKAIWVSSFFYLLFSLPRDLSKALKNRPHYLAGMPDLFEIGSITSREEFLRAFAALVGRDGTDLVSLDGDKFKAVVNEQARRLGVSGEELQGIFREQVKVRSSDMFEYGGSSVNPFYAMTVWWGDYLDLLKRLGPAIPSEAVREAYNAVGTSVVEAVIAGKFTTRSAAPFLDYIGPLLSAEQKRGLDGAFVRDARSLLENYLSGMHFFFGTLKQAVTILKEKGAFGENLRQRLVANTALRMQTLESATPTLEMLALAGWSGQQEKEMVYGALVAAVAQPPPDASRILGRPETIRELVTGLHSQAEIPPHIAVLVQAEFGTLYYSWTDIFRGLVAWSKDLLGPIAAKGGEEAEVHAKAALERIIGETLALRTSQGPVGREKFDVAANLVRVYVKGLGNGLEPKLVDALQESVRAGVDSGDYKGAYALALALAGDASKIDSAPFAEAAGNIASQRFEVLNRGLVLGSQLERLEDLAGKASFLEEHFGNKLHILQDELQEAAKMMTLRGDDGALAYYAAKLVLWHVNVNGKPPQLQTELLANVKRAFELVENRRNRSYLGGSAVVIQQTVQQAYEALFGHPISRPTGAAASRAPAPHSALVIAYMQTPEQAQRALAQFSRQYVDLKHVPDGNALQMSSATYAAVHRWPQFEGSVTAIEVRGVNVQRPDVKLGLRLEKTPSEGVIFSSLHNRNLNQQERSGIEFLVTGKPTNNRNYQPHYTNGRRG